MVWNSMSHVGLEADYGVSREAIAAMSDTWHYGWQWKGPEPACPCKRADCGLITTVNPRCTKHKPHYGAARQLHKSIDCPSLGEPK